MKRLLYILMLCAITALFFGCSSRSVNTPDSPATKQFRFEGITNFNLAEPYHHANITYHTSEEMESLLNEKITKILIEKRLITSDENASVLKIDAVYSRRFMGDQTFAKTDSLSYPFYSYTIEILDSNGTLLKKRETKIRQFNEGGFDMNLKAAAGRLRDKSDELQFIDTFAYAIVEDINPPPRANDLNLLVDIVRLIVWGF
jgi:hypothetical protein